MTLAYALSHSNNIVAIKTLMKIGFERVMDIIHASGITSPLNKYLSLALGCIDTSLVQAAAMLNIFSNRGVYVKPHVLLWIKDELGNKIWKYQPQQQSVMSWSTASQVTRVLEIFMQRMKLRFPQLWPENRTTMGKTGTTNDAKTCWFAGATPDLTTAIYIGRDDNQPLGNNVYASQTVLPLWLSFNKKIASPSSSFSYDPSLQEITVDEWSGQLATSPHQPGAITFFVDKKSIQNKA